MGQKLIKEKSSYSNENWKYLQIVQNQIIIRKAKTFEF